MLILGLDPGLATTGYGLVEGEGAEMRMVAYGVIETPAHIPIGDRLAQLYAAITALLVRYRPQAAAVEELFFATNARTAIMVGEGRGVILLALAQAAVPVIEYTPLQIKQAVTGYGLADKAQVQQMVQLLLSLEAVPKPDDAADALAASICHYNATRYAELARDVE
ncbi:MAG: crossover junction endodeoxyribonuclease RuvC [Anaerolineales bacterium]